MGQYLLLSEEKRGTYYCGNSPEALPPQGFIPFVIYKGDNSFDKMATPRKRSLMFTADEHAKYLKQNIFAVVWGRESKKKKIIFPLETPRSLCLCVCVQPLHTQDTKDSKHGIAE